LGKILGNTSNIASYFLGGTPNFGCKYQGNASNIARYIFYGALNIDSGIRRYALDITCIFRESSMNIARYIADNFKIITGNMA
jgi:hypothetical protein